MPFVDESNPINDPLPDAGVGVTTGVGVAVGVGVVVAVGVTVGVAVGVGVGVATVVVTDTDQLPILPLSVASVSITKSFQTPFGFVPAKVEAKVAVPPLIGPGLLNVVGAGDGKLGTDPMAVGL